MFIVMIFFSLAVVVFFGFLSINVLVDDYVLIVESDVGCCLYIDGMDLVVEGCNVYI